MITNRFLKTILLGTAISCVSTASAAEDFYKEIRKSIKVNNSVRLDMDVSYSDVTITTWEQSVMEIVVKQNVNAKSETRANEIFESIKVNITESADLVGLKVSWGNMSCCNNNENYSITVEVKMPASGTIDGSTAFGDTQLTDLKGPCLLRVEYGTFKAGSLLSHENDFEIAFGDATINTTAGGDFHNEYGELNIRKLTGNADINSAFGDLEIDHVTSDVKALEIKIEYGDADIDLAQGTSFSFDADLSYGEMDLPENSKQTIKNETYSDKHIVGTIGQGGSSMLKIDCDFGDIEIDIDVN